MFDPRQCRQRSWDRTCQIVFTKVQVDKIFHGGADLGGDRTSELVAGEVHPREIGACRNGGGGDAPFQGVAAQVQPPEPSETAELRRYLAGETVAAEVELPEEGEVAQERRDEPGQVGRRQPQRDHPVAAAIADDARPGAVVPGRIP